MNGIHYPKISIIIPVLNEADTIASLLKHISANSTTCNLQELIVVDGGSEDNTAEIAKNCSATVITSKKGRARQMNTGAHYASGQILYFLHADTLPPKDFDKHILGAVAKGAEVGCFRMKFDSDSLFLRSFAYLSRINHTLCRGGDQSLFITKAIFEKENGFDEHYLIYEDSEFIGRLYKTREFFVLPQKVITSARKYRQIGIFKVQFHFAMIHLKNYLGIPPEELYNYYKKHLL